MFHCFYFCSTLGSFKNALVTPLYKGNGHKTDLGNYRPVNLLNVYSKIFEKAIKHRLINYLEENQLLPASQYGFRKRAWD